MKPQITSLSEAEKAWIADQYKNAIEFVRSFCPEDPQSSLTLRALDRAFSYWQKDASSSDIDRANRIINAVGVAFGQCLVDGLELQWAIATDEDGPDLAVHGLPGTGEIVIYPANFVAKRWERRESDFLEPSYLQIASDVQKIKNQWGVTDR